jgi:hypothetical protein
MGWGSIPWKASRLSGFPQNPIDQIAAQESVEKVELANLM